MAFTYISELFPTKIRGLSSGLVICCARLCNCFAPLIENIADETQLHPLVISSIPAVLGLYASFMLPETAKKNLIN